MTLERIYAPRPERDAPSEQEAAHLYRLLRVWMKWQARRKVVWWNNCRVSLETIAQSNAEIGDVYRALDKVDFDAFMGWVSTAGRAAPDLERRTFACRLTGEVRDARTTAQASVRFSLEDVLLHRRAYWQILSDLRIHRPDWIPFFFRGAVPLGLFVTGELANSVSKVPDALSPETLHWLPGLAHDTEDTARPPEDWFVEELKQRRARAKERLCVWVLDVTFTGSTAFSNLTKALRRIDPRDGVPIDVTVAAMLPVENNVEKGVRKQVNAVDLRLRGRNGCSVYLVPMKHPGTVRRLEVRIYPVARSLTEDEYEALELGYGVPINGHPVYLRRLSGNLNLQILYRGRTLVLDLASSGTQRADTPHDFVFNASNRRRLANILRAFELPGHMRVAAKHALRSRYYRQYSKAPIVFTCSPGGSMKRLSTGT